MYLYSTSYITFFFVHAGLTVWIVLLSAEHTHPKKRQVMQAFLKGATVQTTKLQKDKASAGSSAEKKVKAVPWVEK